MANDTIASGGTYVLTVPLTNGTNIEFLNEAGNSGVLIIPENLFNFATHTSSGSITAYLGGRILNFQPGAFGIGGNEVTLQHVAQLFTAINPGNTAENADFTSKATNGAGLQQFLLEPDGTLIYLPFDGYTFTAHEISLINEMVIATFGTDVAADGATLNLQFVDETDPHSNTKFADMVITTTNVPVNPCFAAGTRILTPRGEVPVETLAAGDLVISRDGEEQRIVWTGRRSVDIATHPRPETVRPIIIEPDALADGVPARRLVLSPDHALFLDGLLVQAKDLLNWTTIRPDAASAEVTYHHIELERHDLVFAEGVAAETYLDTGHRGVFEGEASEPLAHPAIMQRRRDAQSFAPLCLGGPALEALRHRLAARQLGIRLA